MSDEVQFYKEDINIREEHSDTGIISFVRKICGLDVFRAWTVLFPFLEILQ